MADRAPNPPPAADCRPDDRSRGAGPGPVGGRQRPWTPPAVPGAGRSPAWRSGVVLVVLIVVAILSLALWTVDAGRYARSSYAVPRAVLTFLVGVIGPLAVALVARQAGWAHRAIVQRGGRDRWVLFPAITGVPASVLGWATLAAAIAALVFGPPPVAGWLAEWFGAAWRVPLTLAAVGIVCLPLPFVGRRPVAPVPAAIVDRQAATVTVGDVVIPVGAVAAVVQANDDAGECLRVGIAWYERRTLRERFGRITSGLADDHFRPTITLVGTFAWPTTWSAAEWLVTAIRDVREQPDIVVRLDEEEAAGALLTSHVERFGPPPLPLVVQGARPAPRPFAWLGRGVVRLRRPAAAVRRVLRERACRVARRQRPRDVDPMRVDIVELEPGRLQILIERASMVRTVEVDTRTTRVVVRVDRHVVVEGDRSAQDRIRLRFKLYRLPACMIVDRRNTRLELAGTTVFDLAEVMAATSRTAA